MKRLMLIIIMSCLFLLLPYVVFGQMTPPPPEPSTEKWMLYLDPATAMDMIQELGPMLQGRNIYLEGVLFCIEEYRSEPMGRPYYRWICVPQDKILYLKENNR